MNLLKKLIEVRKEVAFLQKDTKAYNYKYVSEDKVLFAIKDKMDELGILLVPSVKNHTQREFEYTNKRQEIIKENIVSGDMIFTWLDSDSEDKLEVDFALYGQQQDSSQAFGSGLTYCNRYFLLKFFQVATSENDPDKVVSKKREKEEKTLSGAKISLPQVDKIQQLIKDDKLDSDRMKAYYKVNTIQELNYAQATQIIKGKS
jgi:hypothetical protein